MLKHKHTDSKPFFGQCHRLYKTNVGKWCVLNFWLTLDNQTPTNHQWSNIGVTFGQRCIPIRQRTNNNQTLVLHCVNIVYPTATVITHYLTFDQSKHVIWDTIDSTYKNRQKDLLIYLIKYLYKRKTILRSKKKKKRNLITSNWSFRDLVFVCALKFT